MSARRVTDPAELIEFYGDDARLHIYALADLEEPYWSASTWWRDGDAVVGLVTLPDGEGDLVYAVASRDPEGTLRLLDGLVDDLAPGVLLTGPTGMGELLAGRQRLAWHRSYHRYVLDDHDTVGEPSGEVVDLGPTDADEIVQLNERAPGAAFFRPSMLRNDTFAGVRREGRLVAAAGTHVFSHDRRAAAIGAVLTDPDWRRHGFAADVARGTVRRLRGRADLIGLNCADGNDAGRRLWTGLGFRPLLGYEEAELA